MSHYARLVLELKATTAGGEFRATLAPGTQIKSVRSVDDGYLFEAQIRPPYERAAKWVELHTPEDLPAFTDKGQAHRARRATLRQGRPTVSTEAATHRLVCKVTEAQAEAVEAIAAAEDTNVPGLIRKALTERGMPE